MKIAVCIKQVPASARAVMDPERGLLVRVASDSRMNPYDAFALEAALRLREALGGAVTVFCMGPPSAEAVLREALALGADEAVLLCDRAFAGADVFATSYTLACALKKAGGFDLVVCGRQTTDGDTAQTPFSLGARLGIAVLGWVMEIAEVTEKEIRVRQEVSGGAQGVSCALPVCLAVDSSLRMADGTVVPRLPSLAGRLRAKQKPLFVWGLADMDDTNEGHYGLAASPTRVKRVYAVERERRAQAIFEPAELAAARILALVRESEKKGLHIAEQCMEAGGAPCGGDILVFLQITGARVHGTSLELVAAARRLGGRVIGVAAVAALEPSLRQALCSCWADAVDCYVGEGYRDFVAEYFAAALVDCVQRRSPEVLLVGATPEGRSIAPLAAVPLGSGVTADCTALAFDEQGLLVQTRPAYGGDIMADILTPHARPQIATVRGGALGDVPAEALHYAELFERDAVLPVMAGALPRVSAPCEAVPEGMGEPEIAVVIGAGVREKEDVALFERVSRVLGAELFCTRSLVERGYLPHSRQVGLSGRSVAPRLLIAFGVSGSVQFFAGIRHAESVCAVNLDAESALMHAADVPLAADLYAVAQEILRQA